jgi:hypothetical protein
MILLCALSHTSYDMVTTLETRQELMARLQEAETRAQQLESNLAEEHYSAEGIINCCQP